MTDFTPLNDKSRRGFGKTDSGFPRGRYTEIVPKVTFLPSGETFEFESGKLKYKEHGKPESLLDVAMNFGFHLEHACGGNCACTTCHVVVKKGANNLSEMDDDELDRVEQAADYQLNSRLGCQCIVTGDVVVDIPAWNRNYISEGGTSILGDGIPPPKKMGFTEPARPDASGQA